MERLPPVPVLLLGTYRPPYQPPWLAAATQITLAPLSTEDSRQVMRAVFHRRLRAVTSLSRVWQRQGKHAAAQRVLADVYGWCSEGFATADLRAAQACLTRLA